MGMRRGTLEILEKVKDSLPGAAHTLRGEGALDGRGEANCSRRTQSGRLLL